MIVQHLQPTTPNLNEQKESFKFSTNLDHEFLHKNYDENLDLAVSIFEHFQTNIDSDLNSIQEQIDAKDFKGIQIVAHKIKNNFTYVGASHLTSLVNQIEKEAKDNDLQVINSFKRFKETSEDTLNSIYAQLNSLKRHLHKK